LNGTITDSVNFLSKLTPQKVFNATKVVSSYYLSKWTHNPYVWGQPISISVEPTTSCNLRCPECPSGLRSFTRPTGMLDPTFFKETIESVYKNVSYLIFYFQGEPYLNPHFLDMVKYASKKGIYTATSTNAHYLDDENAKATVESGLDRLIISIDGTTQEVYEAYRKGGKIEKVLEGTRNVIKWKKKLNSNTPNIIFQYLVVKPNEHQIHDVKSLAESLGVDEVRFKSAQIYDYKNGNPLIPEDESFSRYKKQDDGTYTIKNQLLNHCWKLWHSCVITWDGKVIPCCFDKDAQYSMGELSGQSLSAVWGNKKYKEFRSSVLLSRGNVEMCNNCTEGTEVWVN